MPSPEARERIRMLNDSYKTQILAMAMVLPGHGLWTSSMRVVGNTMMMVIPAPYARRLHGSVEDATSWLETELGAKAAFQASQVHVGAVQCRHLSEMIRYHLCRVSVRYRL
jgi:hypothetical protein